MEFFSNLADVGEEFSLHLESEKVVFLAIHTRFSVCDLLESAQEKDCTGQAGSILWFSGGRATEKVTSFLISVLTKWWLKGMGAWEEEKARGAGREQRSGEKERKKARETRMEGDRMWEESRKKIHGKTVRGEAGRKKERKLMRLRKGEEGRKKTIFDLLISISNIQ